MAATSPEVLVDQGDASRSDGRGHVAALTGLRGFAALVVVVVHCSSLTAFPWVGFHSYGPIALFVLSGFLLFQPWSRWMVGAAKRPSISRFAWRRLWRIFPAYLVLLGLVTLIYPPSRPNDWSGWLRSMTLTHIYEPGNLTRGLYHTWSLGTELSWYVALPIVAVGIGLAIGWLRISATKVLTVAVLITLLVTLGWRWAAVFVISDPQVKMTSAYLLPAFAFCFAGGAFIGHMRVLQVLGNSGTPRVMRWLSNHPVLTLAAALTAGVTGASRLGGPWTLQAATFAESTIRWTGMTTMAMLLVAGVASSPERSVIRLMFSWRPVAAIGRWSYGIYLWHMPLLLILHRDIGAQPGPLGLLMWIILVTAISIPFGAVTYRFVELPAIAWSKRTQPRGLTRVQQPA